MSAGGTDQGGGTAPASIRRRRARAALPGRERARAADAHPSTGRRPTSARPVAGRRTCATAVSLCLTSRFPILIWWGPDLNVLYNDAYIPFLGGAKHPSSLGRPGREVWAEIWDTIGPMLEGVRRTGAATWSDDFLSFFERDAPARGGPRPLHVRPDPRGRRPHGRGRLLPLHRDHRRGGRGQEAGDAPQARRQVAGVALRPGGVRRGGAGALGGPARHPVRGHLRRRRGGRRREPGRRRPACPRITRSRPRRRWPRAMPPPGRSPPCSAAGGRRRSGTCAGSPGLSPARPGRSHRAARWSCRSPPRITAAWPACSPSASARAASGTPAYRAFFDLVAGHIGTALADARAHEAERRRAEALAETRPREDGVLLERQPRVPHPADPDARPGRGRRSPTRTSRCRRASASGWRRPTAAACGC